MLHGQVFVMFNSDNENLPMQNVDCGCMLEGLGAAVLMSTHYQCFGAKIRKNKVYPCKPQFYYVKVVYEGVYILQTYFPDELGIL